LKKKFSFPALLVVVQLIICFWRTTKLSGSFLLVDLFYPIQILLFTLFIASLFDFRKILSFKVIKISYERIIGILVIVFFVISIIINFSFSDMLKIIGYPTMVIMFFYYYPKYLSKNIELLEKFFNYILFFSTISSFLSLIGYLGIVNMNPFYFNSTIGIYHSPNTTPFIYTVSIPILIYKYSTKKMKLSIFVVLMCLFLFCLLFTYSRAGYLGVSIAFLILAYSKSKKSFIAAVIILVAVIFLIGLEFSNTKGVGSILSRGTLWLTAWDMIFRNTNSTLWGYGISKSLKIFVDEKIFFGNVELSVIEPHNFILFLSIQFGLLFTLFLLNMIFTIIIKGLYYKNKIKDKSNLIGLGVSVCLGLIFQNLLESYLSIYEFFIVPIFLFFLGYIYFSYRVRNIKL
jgi:O-antigen ligase